MVYAYGDEKRLTHPRYERYERTAGAVPETTLLESPRPRRTAAARAASFADTPARMPDDPGVPEEEEDSGDTGEAA